jgi:hypothetical protein
MTTKFYQYEAVKDGLSEVKKLVERLRNDYFIARHTDLHAISYDGEVSIIDTKGRLGLYDGDELDFIIHHILTEHGFYGEYQRIGLLNIYYDN